MELEKLLREIERAHLVGNPPGNPNYRLMGLLADLVEYVGRHGDTLPEAIDSHLQALVQEYDTALFYRQVELLRHASSDAIRRQMELERGIVAFKVDLRAVLLRTPKLTTPYPSLMIA